jgi:hypothetical protein
MTILASSLRRTKQHCSAPSCRNDVPDLAWTLYPDGRRAACAECSASLAPPSLRRLLPALSGVQPYADVALVVTADLPPTISRRCPMSRDLLEPAGEVCLVFSFGGQLSLVGEAAVKQFWPGLAGVVDPPKVIEAVLPAL